MFSKRSHAAMSEWIMPYAHHYVCYVCVSRMCMRYGKVKYVRLFCSLHIYNKLKQTEEAAVEERKKIIYHLECSTFHHAAAEHRCSIFISLLSANTHTHTASEAPEQKAFSVDARKLLSFRCLLSTKMPRVSLSMNIMQSNLLWL